MSSRAEVIMGIGATYLVAAYITLVAVLGVDKPEAEVTKEWQTRIAEAGLGGWEIDRATGEREFKLEGEK